MELISIIDVYQRSSSYSRTSCSRSHYGSKGTRDDRTQDAQDTASKDRRECGEVLEAELAVLLPS